MNKDKVVIYGTGPLSQAAALDMIDQYQYDVVCFIDEKNASDKKEILGISVFDLQDGIDMAVIHEATIYITTKKNSSTVIKQIKSEYSLTVKHWASFTNLFLYEILFCINNAISVFFNATLIGIKRSNDQL